jgi:effector-binding domain-containing protein
LEANAEYEVRIDQVPMGLIAAVRGRANAENIGTTIRQLYDQLYAFVRKSRLQTGQNVVLYGGLSTPESIPIEAGVQVSAPFDSDGTVICSATPEGAVATCTHQGEYEKLAAAHKAIMQWCRENGHALAGPAWEIYGDWADDPAQRRTDVFYLLK